MGKNMRKLNGRRVRLKDLLAADLIADGDEITISVGTREATATVVEPGRIRLASGRLFQAPSPAGAEAVQSGSLPGWHYWRTSEGRTLDSLRQELLDRVASETADSDEPLEPGTLSPAGSLWLKQVRDRALEGESTTVPVRTLLGFWGLDRRDGVAANHVVAALAERGLVADPDVLATSLDDSVVISSLAKNIAGLSGLGKDRTGDESTSISGVGLTLSSFMDADRPLVSVQSQHTLGQARSEMRVNGYSQLAVLNGKTLKGAITWESITQALFDGSTASSPVTEAQVPAQGHPADQHLLEVIGEIAINGFVIVMGKAGPAGIVTYSDIADSFVDLATPFALIGELDRRLRGVLDETLEWEFLQEILEHDGAKTPSNIDELGFGHYVTAFASKEVWDQLGWWMIQSVFVSRLDELRLVRNKVTHFNPDPPTPEDIEKLRLFNDLVIDLIGG